jgi:hypothetical protein
MRLIGDKYKSFCPFYDTLFNKNVDDKTDVNQIYLETLDSCSPESHRQNNNFVLCHSAITFVAKHTYNTITVN